MTAYRTNSFLAAVAYVWLGCSSSDHPSAGASSGGPAVVTGSGSPAGSSDGGGGGDASIVDAGTDAKPIQCHTIPNGDAPEYTITYSADPQPDPSTFVGGTITDGTYFETTERHYTESLPNSKYPGVKLTIAGDTFKYGAYTADKEFVSQTAMFVTDATTTPPTITVTQTCPAAGSSLGPQPYTVNGNELVISFGLYTVTYTKQ